MLVVAGIAGIAGFATTASAVVTKTYTLENSSTSHLFTAITSNKDYLTGTTATPTWTTDPDPGSGHSAATTKNTITIEFSGGADDNVIEGGDTVTVTDLDFFHALTGGIAGATGFTISGLTDSSVSGAVGTLGGMGGGSGQVVRVPVWGNDFNAGELHNELLCTNNGATAWCGVAGGLNLPEPGVLDVTHEDGAGILAPYAISILGSPDQTSQPMIFDDTFTDVCFEIELATPFGRLYYVMTSNTSADVCNVQSVPASDGITLAILIALMGMTGAYAMYRKTASPLA